jgi:hypothetical protein
MARRTRGSARRSGSGLARSSPSRAACAR